MRILIVEDEEKVCRFVSRGLRGEGFAVDEAANGETGLELLGSSHYDLIILDIMLPQISGTELLRIIRARALSTPVLMLTAKDLVADKVMHFEAGADDYLTKPFSFAELQARAKALMLRGQMPRTSKIKIGNLEIDRLSRQVRRAGKRIELSAKEHALLEYMATNAGRVLSRSMIMEHVWDQSFRGLTNIVDVYVRQLRIKIDDEQEQKLIHTVRGLGYRMSDEEA